MHRRDVIYYVSTKEDEKEYLVFRRYAIYPDKKTTELLYLQFQVSIFCLHVDFLSKQLYICWKYL